MKNDGVYYDLTLLRHGWWTTCYHTLTASMKAAATVMVRHFLDTSSAPNTELRKGALQRGTWAVGAKRGFWRAWIRSGKSSR